MASRRKIFDFKTPIDENITLVALWEVIILEKQYTKDLFISEYIEGSSYNKAIELYNGTGSSIDLSNYRIVMYNFGKTGNLSNIYSEELGGLLGHNTTCILANTGASEEIAEYADIFADSVINFNGNDPVHLEKLIDGIWEPIDVFGEYVEGEASTLEAADNTYVRNKFITGPSLKWDLGDWDILDKDDFTNIGNHLYELLPIIITHEVVFDSNGGSDIDPIHVASGNTAMKPNDPVYEGYRFLGWCLNDEAYNFITPILDNLTLVAKWELITVSNVSNQDELIKALSNSNIREINLLSDILLTEKLILQRDDVILNGNGHKLISPIESGWQSNYILQVYEAEQVILKNLIFQGGDAGLLVNGSKVIIENITLNEQEFGGIEVSQGVNVLETPKLTVLGDLNSNLYELPPVWIDGKTTNDGWVALPAESELTENVYTEAGKQQVWFINVVPDTTAPDLVNKSLEVVNGKLVLTVEAEDDNLYSLEIDHSLNTNEFTVYASEQDPYGGQAEAFAALDVTVTYTNGVWTITFGNGAMDLIKSVTTLNTFKVHMVIADHAGNIFGSMSPTTPENTVGINIYNIDYHEDETTTTTARLFEGETVELPVLADKGELQFMGWFTDVERTVKYTEGVSFGDVALYAKYLDKSEIKQETYTQGFEDEFFIGTATAYSSEENGYIDAHGFTWSYKGRNDNLGSEINGHGMVLGHVTDDSYIKVVATGGISSITLKTVRVNTGKGSRSLKLLVNGEEITTWSVKASEDLVETHTFDLSETNIKGNVTIEIRTGTSTRAIKVDDLSWISNP